MLVEEQHKAGKDALDTQSMLIEVACVFDIEFSDDLLDFVDMLHLNLEKNNGTYNYKTSPFVS